MFVASGATHATNDLVGADGATPDPAGASILLVGCVMRATFPPTPLQVAVLLGWTVYGAVRERLVEFEARFRRRPVAVAEAPQPATRVAERPRIARPDYSIN
jgi:hypothetical protein